MNKRKILSFNFERNVKNNFTPQNITKIFTSKPEKKSNFIKKTHVNLLPMLLQIRSATRQLITFDNQLLSCFFQFRLKFLINHFPL